VIRSFLQKQRHVTGFSPEVLLKTLKWLPTYFKDLRRYRQLNSSSSFSFSLRDAFPILTDLESSAGVAGGHYFHQDLWAARKIYERRPVQHFDIGSRVDGFIAHLLVFMPVTVIDIRPMTSDISGLTFLQDNAATLAQIPSGSILSLSSLHVAEHFGLAVTRIRLILQRASSSWHRCSECLPQAGRSCSRFQWDVSGLSSMLTECSHRGPF
jgi:hypothetical protein